MEFRIKITAEEAPAYLEMLPGGPDLYRELARIFLAEVERGPRPDPVEVVPAVR